MRNLKENNKKYYVFAIFCVAVVILYRVFPIDFLPDFVDGIGLADDVIIAVIGLIAAIVSFFTGLGLGVKFTGSAEKRMKWQDDFEKTYGNFL
ncbi:MAG: DUF1232 domain-containing protein [Lachnospiraceae bacterium]|nr:DUF1232 domain-containing protein [Lachnospiraceae bacterium]